MANQIKACVINNEETGRCTLEYQRILNGHYYSKEFDGLAELVAYIRDNKIPVPISQFFNVRRG